jgi:putative ABC transport system permease protein
MINPRWRKIFRDLWNAKLRTFLVVLSIAVGVFAIGMIAGTQTMLDKDIPASYNGVNPSHAILVVDMPFDDDLLQTVRRVDGVKQAEGRRTANVRAKVQEPVPAGSPTWRTLSLDTTIDFQKHQIDLVRPVNGAWPPPDRGLLIERNSIQLLNAKVGNLITIETPDGKHHELPIVGLAHDLNKPPAAFTGTMFGYANMDTMEWLGFPRNPNVLRLTTTQPNPTQKHVQEVADRVKDKVEKGGRAIVFTRIPPPGEHPAVETINTFMLILGVLGGLSLFLSGFLVVNTIMAILAQQMRQIGMMKAVGALTPQIVGMYLTSVLIYGALSLFVAVPLGGWAAYEFTKYIASLINFDMGAFYIPTNTLMLEVGVGLITPVVAALAPIFTGARITVREALSTYNTGKGAYGRGWIDRIVGRVRGLSRPVLLSVRNTFRRKGRLALTLFTLTLGGAIFIAVLTVHSSLFATLDSALEYWQYDVDLDFTQVHRIDQIEREALSVPGVVAAESWGGAAVRRVRPNEQESQTYPVVAPPAQTQMIKPVILEGRWLVPEDENAIVINTEVTKEEEKQGTPIKLGDLITLKIGGRNSQWRVVGIARAIMTGPVMYANYPYFSRTVRNVGRGGGLQVMLAQHDAQTQARTASALKEHFDSLGMKVRQTQTTSQIRQTIEYQFNIIVVFMTIMAILLAIVGGLGLMGTMSINVLERAREIGVMRAIGASNTAVLQVFMTEGILIGALSWFVGAIFALPIGKILSDVVGMAFMRAPLNFAFSVNGTFFWLALVIILAGLASILPSWRAMRLSIREVLAYE